MAHNADLKFFYLCSRFIEKFNLFVKMCPKKHELFYTACRHKYYHLIKLLYNDVDLNCYNNVILTTIGYDTPLYHIKLLFQFTFFNDNSQEFLFRSLCSYDHQEGIKYFIDNGYYIRNIKKYVDNYPKLKHIILSNSSNKELYDLIIEREKLTHQLHLISQSPPPLHNDSISDSCIII